MKAFIFIITCVTLFFGLTQNQIKQLYYPMGKKIYQKVCPKDRDLKQLSQEELFAKKICGNLNKKEYQALFIYLHDKDIQQIKESITFTKKDKCPVCGMFVYKYPKWVAQIIYKNKSLSFDGVKDMMKFYYNPDEYGRYKKEEIKQKNVKLLVHDYYTQKVIDAKKAYFVLGSNILGPMGNELIPFENIKEAKTFKNEHFGREIKSFDELNEDIVWSLDE